MYTSTYILQRKMSTQRTDPLDARLLRMFLRKYLLLYRFKKNFLPHQKINSLFNLKINTTFYQLLRKFVDFRRLVNKNKPRYDEFMMSFNSLILSH